MLFAICSLPAAPVWPLEDLAQQGEAIFVRLADDLRRAPDKTQILARFDFDSIQIPRPAGPPIRRPLGIQEQRFNNATSLTLTHVAWETALDQFRSAGWTLRQFDWQHERFVAASAGRPALSEFAFELHGEQVTQSNRFILRGRLEVQWAVLGTHGAPLHVGPLALRDLILLERSGPPGFNNHLVVAPEPDRPQGQVNLHPLIVIDVNGDSHDDIVLPGVNKLLLNDGHAGFQPSAFIRPEQYYALQGAGVMADFDGDGHLDYLGVAEMGPLARNLVLYLGDGAWPMASAPIAAWPQQLRSSRYQLTAASVITAGDIDGDGDLDLFVAQYRPPYVGGNLPTPYYDANDGYPAWLLLNDGHGRFSLAPDQPALQAKQRRRTLSASFCDLDADGDMDLVTMNDFCGVDLYYNDGRGHFTDETGRLDNRHLFGMGHAIADFDADGRLDLLAIGMDVPTVRRLESMKPGGEDTRTRKRSDMGWGNRLYVEHGGHWVEPGWSRGLARSGWSWGASAFDFDNDGRLDLYIANGHVSGASSADYDTQYWTRDIYLSGSQPDPRLQRQLEGALQGLNSGQTSWNGYQHNVLFLDMGTNDYLNVAFLMGVAHETDGRAVVTADLNGDGRADLLVTEAIWQGTPNKMRHRLLVHLNNLPSENHWIGARLAPSDRGASSIGATISVVTKHRTYRAQLVVGDSFQSQHPSVARFGLGESTEVSELRVVWPDGRSRVLKNPGTDRYHAVFRD